MTITLNIDHNEIERRKHVYRRIFDYQPVDHLPVFIWVQGSTSADAHRSMGAGEQRKPACR